VVQCGAWPAALRGFCGSRLAVVPGDSCGALSHSHRCPGAKLGDVGKATGARAQGREKQEEDGGPDTIPTAREEGANASARWHIRRVHDKPNTTEGLPGPTPPGLLMGRRQHLETEPWAGIPSTMHTSMMPELESGLFSPERGLLGGACRGVAMGVVPKGSA
jgi:hypothetical protein